MGHKQARPQEDTRHLEKKQILRNSSFQPRETHHDEDPESVDVPIERKEVSMSEERFVGLGVQEYGLPV